MTFHLGIGKRMESENTVVPSSDEPATAKNNLSVKSSAPARVHVPSPYSIDGLLGLGSTKDTTNHKQENDCSPKKREPSRSAMGHTSLASDSTGIGCATTNLCLFLSLRNVSVVYN